MAISVRSEKAIKKVIEAIKEGSVTSELKKNTLIFRQGKEVISRFTLQSLIKKRYARRK